MKLRFKRTLFLSIDISVSVLSFWVAFLLRFEGNIPLHYLQIFQTLCPLVIFIRGIIFFYLNYFRTAWQNYSAGEVVSLIKGSTLGSVFILSSSYFFQLGNLPRSVLFVDWLFLIVFLGALRLCYRLFYRKRAAFDIERLLSRKLAEFDFVDAQKIFKGKKVLITGAGGSIGGELARVVSGFDLERLILIDNSEGNLVEIEQELKAKGCKCRVIYKLIDITIREDVKNLFSGERPDFVFHAAACKHLPVAEANPLAAIRINVVGTQIVAQESIKNEVEKFVFISTDKAVYPQSVMGVTKRICELYLKNQQSRNTRFLIVRFGNVFNSKGSVVPLFLKQLKERSEVTVTHPEVSRFFMGLSEAVSLILHAATIGKDNEVFVLEMGKPVKIVDLAYMLAESLGIDSSELKITFTGLRSGEKLNEQLYREDEILIATAHEKIKICQTTSLSAIDDQSLNDFIAQLGNRGVREEQIKQKLFALLG